MTQHGQKKKLYKTRYTISEVDKKMKYSKINTTIMTKGFILLFIKTKDKNYKIKDHFIEKFPKQILETFKASQKKKCNS